MKSIRGACDLAVNGAEPAFAEPIHVGRPNLGDRDAFVSRVSEIFDRRWLSNNGPVVQEFEDRIARYLGVAHCVAMCNGTLALEVAIRAAGLQGEVIVPSYTFVATAHALHWQGITPVFADIDPVTHNLDPESVRRLVTPRTTGIVPVHVWGRPAPTAALEAVAAESGLQVIYDAAHAFGCSHDRRMIGSNGVAEVLSFHATKFFNTLEGGALVTNDDSLADRARRMRNFGFSGWDNVTLPGTNAKMIEVCAAMGLVNLDRIDTFIDINRSIYHQYRRRIDRLPGLSILPFPEHEACNYQYVVLVVDETARCSRDEIHDALVAENVLVRKYFWPGCHRMAPYRDLWPDAGARLPVTEDVASRVLVLPTGSALPKGAVDLIADVISVVLAGAQQPLQQVHAGSAAALSGLPAAGW